MLVVVPSFPHPKLKTSRPHCSCHFAAKSCTPVGVCSTPGASMAHTAATGQLANHWSKKNKEQLKTISDSCQDNFELQLLVLGTIMDYKQASGDKGLSSVIGDFKNQKKEILKKRKAGEMDKMTRPQLPPVNDTIGRSQKCFTKWSKESLRDVLLYCDDSLDLEGMQCLDKTRLLELMEFSFGIRCFGAVLDKVGDTCKRNVYLNMAAQYKANSNPLRKIQHKFHMGYIDWAQHGHYHVVFMAASDSDDGKAKCTVTSLTLNKTVFVPQEFVDSDDFSGVVICANFSQYHAFLKTASETYMISSLFPLMSRQLKKRSSDESGITHKCPGGAAPVCPVTPRGSVAAWIGTPSTDGGGSCSRESASRTSPMDEQPPGDAQVVKDDDEQDMHIVRPTDGETQRD